MSTIEQRMQAILTRRDERARKFAARLAGQPVEVQAVAGLFTIMGLAQLLGVKTASVQQWVGGRRPWPERRLAQVREMHEILKREDFGK